MSVYDLNPREGGFLWRDPPDLRGIFGSGKDGDITYDGGGTVTLSDHVFARNLFITNGTIVNPDGWGIWVADTLTIDETCGLARHGNPASTWLPGAAVSGAGPFFPSSGIGGLGGLSGNGSPGANAGNSYCADGGSGGDEGPPPGYGAGGAGGTASNPSAVYVPPFAWPFNMIAGVTHGAKSSGFSDFQLLNGGAGGGGGGGTFATGNPGGGGGGGAGGIALFARHVRHAPGTADTTSRNIAAIGGSGAAGSGDYGGSGGGGGGGCLFLCYQRGHWVGQKPGAAQVAGGPSPAPIGDWGGYGTPGSTGNVYFLEV